MNWDVDCSIKVSLLFSYLIAVKKSKEHDEMRRVIARMIRMSLSDKPPELIQPATLSDENVKESQHVQPITIDQSRKSAGAVNKPPPATRYFTVKMFKNYLRLSSKSHNQFRVKTRINFLSSVKKESVEWEFTNFWYRYRNLVCFYCFSWHYLQPILVFF